MQKYRYVITVNYADGSEMDMRRDLAQAFDDMTDDVWAWLSDPRVSSIVLVASKVR